MNICGSNQFKKRYNVYNNTDKLHVTYYYINQYFYVDKLMYHEILDSFLKKMRSIGDFVKR